MGVNKNDVEDAGRHIAEVNDVPGALASFAAELDALARHPNNRGTSFGRGIAFAARKAIERAQRAAGLVGGEA